MTLMQIPKVPWLKMKKKRASSDDDTVGQRDEDSESESIFLDTPWDSEPGDQRRVCVASSRSAATRLRCLCVRVGFMCSAVV